MKDSDRFNMPMVVGKEFRFEAGHSLKLVPEGHKCGRYHGHSYRVMVYAEGFITRTNEWVEDYGIIAEAVDPIIKLLDHTDLNEILPYETTAENLAFWIARQICHHKWMSGIEVYETPTSVVRLRIR